MILTRVCLLLFCSLYPISQAMGQVTGQVDRGAVAIHYQVLGEGFPVVLLSGGPGASSSALLPIARTLDDKYKVVLIDQRGTGLSRLTALDSSTITLENYVEDVDAVRRHLGIDRWLLVGHSWGGGLTMAAMKSWSDPERRVTNPERAAYEYYRALLPSRLYRPSDLHLILENLVVEQDFSTIAELMTQDLRRDQALSRSYRELHASAPSRSYLSSIHDARFG